MSFSKPKLQNPCSKFIEYKGSRGVFQYWDKEHGKNIEIETPFFFIVLDQLSTIKGYSDNYNCGIYSNEVHYLDSEILKVKSFKGGFSATGIYKDIKGEIISAGGKFAKSIYCMAFDKDLNCELVNFQLYGSSIGPWFEFKFDFQRNAVGITGETIDKIKGTTKYKEPIFKKYGIKEELIESAIEMDKQLQDYFSQYKAQKIESEIEKEEKTDTEILHETNFEQDKMKVYNVKGMDNEQTDMPF
ncbi:MAG: hypothetical protein HN704_18345 [Bacteroidetes bacterium]|jgi:hypothetical protein|nr:hypothetical protein [Bacteroidota bacterium]MBT7493564.1 hypothetical protein [Bacteroidota bacterium]